METRKAVSLPPGGHFGRVTALGVVEGGGDIMKIEIGRKTSDREPAGRAFKVTVSELYQREVTVYESEMKEATPEEAVRVVENWWKDSQIILTNEDFQGVEYSVAEEEKPEGGE